MGSFIGIDLGTTFSVVAIIDEHGKPVIVSDGDGETLTPSCIAWDPENNKFEVGSEFARRTVYSGIATDVGAGFFKRDMGTSKTYSLNGKDHTPTDLSTMVLEELVSSRAEHIGEIDEVVVTVPANFANEAREATMEAARRAKLNVQYIINEPTAAALCYSFREGMDLKGIYAIYDMGGGTFDISIIRIKDKDVEVLTSNGIAKLGGIDFDRDLKKLAEEKYQDATGESLEDLDYILLQAEELKKELSKREKTTERIRGKKTESIQFTRKESEELISAKITQAEMLCESTLEAVNLKPEDIRGVLCAGGSTRIPMVQASIKRVFGQEPIFKANVDEVVALGAAWYALYRGDQEKLSPAQRETISGMNFTERTAKYYGVIAHSNVNGEERRMNSILIKKNTIIPGEASKSFYTMYEGLSGVECTVTESVNEETDLKFVQEHEPMVLPISRERPAGQEIKATFRYDVNQTMHCSFKDVETGNEITSRVSAGGEGPESKESETKLKPDPDINDFTVE